MLAITNHAVEAEINARLILNLILDLDRCLFWLAYAICHKLNKYIFLQSVSLFVCLQSIFCNHWATLPAVLLKVPWSAGENIMEGEGWRDVDKHLCGAQQTRGFDLMLFQYWPTANGAGPTLKRHRVNIGRLCLVGTGYTELCVSLSRLHDIRSGTIYI